MVLERYIKRFWSKVEKTDTCWIWGAYKNDRGYGEFYDGTGMKKAHRFAYETVIGPIPAENEIDHLCRVRACVNPEHLEPVTHQINCRRGIGSKTHCKNGHALTSDNLYKSARQRKCRTCNYEINKRLRLARSAA